MMTVYLLMLHGTEVLGVFASEDGAQSTRSDLLENMIVTGSELEIVPFEVTP